MTEKRESLDELQRRADRYLRWSILCAKLAVVMVGISLALQIAALWMRCR